MIINTQQNEALKAIEKINDIAEQLDKHLAWYEVEKTDRMKQAYRQSYDLFWANPIEICAEAGNQAYLLFTKHVEMGATIKSRKPDFEELTIPAGWEVEANQDGTVDLKYTEPNPIIEE